MQTAYGAASCRWTLEGTQFSLDVDIPPNAFATIVLPGRDTEPLGVGAGTHHWSYPVIESIVAEWADESAPSPPAPAVSGPT